MKPGVHLTSRFGDAFQYARTLHADQTRKGTKVPYLSHLLAVTALVLEEGGDEDQAIAALLHDAAEDQGGLETLAEIRRRYGERVAMIVDALSDTYQNPKPPWQQRKQRYLDHLAGASQDALLVSLADKTHNANTILRDLYQDGVSTFDRFRGGQEGTLWYYRSLVAIFKQAIASPLVDELGRTVQEIEMLVKILQDSNRNTEDER